MSLAAALAADGVRPASFLPSIKCSSCGDEIEIAQMGDHVCSAPPPLDARIANAPRASNPFALRQLHAGGQQPHVPSPLQYDQPAIQTRTRAPTVGSTKSSSGRRSPTVRPRINPDAANRSFLPLHPPLASPISPVPSSQSGGSNGKPAFPRSMTSTAPRLFDPRPPSPELSANLDCAFPPFPTAATSGRRPSAPQLGGRKTPTGSERAPSRGSSRPERPGASLREQTDSGRASPNSNAGENVLNKLNAMKTGPFASNQRQGSAESKDSSVAPDTTRSREPTLDNISQKKPPPLRPARPSEELFSRSFLQQLSTEPDSVVPLTSQETSLEQPPDVPNSFPPRKDSIDANASMPTLSRMRSEPAINSAGRRPSLAQGSISEPFTIPQVPPVPGNDSRDNLARLDSRIQDAPPVPKPIQQHRQDSTHTPSDSGSSISSATNSTPITRSSNSRNGSVTSTSDLFPPLARDAGKELNEKRPQLAGVPPPSHQRPGMRAEQPVQKSPPRNFARPWNAPPESPQKVEDIPLTPLESPMDPAFSQLLSRVETTNELPRPPPKAGQSRPVPLRTTTAPGPVPKAGGLVPPGLSIPTKAGGSDRTRPPMLSSSAPNTRIPSPNTALTPQTPTTPQSRQQSGRRPPTAKPMCRGCGQMIEGKSVKAADGRLTGRWHKACFVCRSCREPFTTADFYVIHNEPYCEQHYHEQNGSLCHGCHRGIEGQYLETSSSTRFGSVDKKFHPRCFTCHDCRVVLSQDYFEITGRVYCEVHALAAMRAQARLAAPGMLGAPYSDRRGLMAERRTTRLINPLTA